MSPTLILFPVFVQIGLTFALLFWMGRSRVGSIKNGTVKMKDIALGQSAWPDRVTQIGNSFHSQFELPLMFYTLAALIIITRQLDIVLLVLAWLFVALRLAHVFVHTTTNWVPTRFNVFVAGAGVLLVMWVVFAARITLATV
jgi:hypothetical protein